MTMTMMIMMMTMTTMTMMMTMMVKIEMTMLTNSRSVLLVQKVFYLLTHDYQNIPTYRTNALFLKIPSCPRLITELLPGFM